MYKKQWPTNTTGYRKNYRKRKLSRKQLNKIRSRGMKEFAMSKKGHRWAGFTY